MGDEELKLILQRAAQDEAFRTALLDDRDATIDSLDLLPHVKAMLKSVPREQLGLMIAQAMGSRRRGIGALAKVALGFGVTAAVGALLLPAATHGVRSETTSEARAVMYLHQIVVAERQYRDEYGTFGTIEQLTQSEDSNAFVDSLLWDDLPYEFTVLVDGETFTAVARHKARPETRKAFVVGPDGAVKELQADDVRGE